jgi:hypothetical protein
MEGSTAGIEVLVSGFSWWRKFIAEHAPQLGHGAGVYGFCGHKRPILWFLMSVSAVWSVKFLAKNWDWGLGSKGREGREI